MADAMPASMRFALDIYRMHKDPTNDLTLPNSLIEIILKCGLLASTDECSFTVTSNVNDLLNRYGVDKDLNGVEPNELIQNNQLIMCVQNDPNIINNLERSRYQHETTTILYNIHTMLSDKVYQKATYTPEFEELFAQLHIEEMNRYFRMKTSASGPGTIKTMNNLPGMSYRYSVKNILYDYLTALINTRPTRHATSIYLEQNMLKTVADGRTYNSGTIDISSFTEHERKIMKFGMQDATELDEEKRSRSVDGYNDVLPKIGNWGYLGLYGLINMEDKRPHQITNALLPAFDRSTCRYLSNTEWYHGGLDHEKRNFDGFTMYPTEKQAYDYVRYHSELYPIGLFSKMPPGYHQYDNYMNCLRTFPQAAPGLRARIGTYLCGVVSQPNWIFSDGWRHGSARRMAMEWYAPEMTSSLREQKTAIAQSVMVSLTRSKSMLLCSGKYKAKDRNTVAVSKRYEPDTYIHYEIALFSVLTSLILVKIMKGDDASIIYKEAGIEYEGIMNYLQSEMRRMLTTLTGAKHFNGTDKAAYMIMAYKTVNEYYDAVDNNNVEEQQRLKCRYVYEYTIAHDAMQTNLKLLTIELVKESFVALTTANASLIDNFIKDITAGDNAYYNRMAQELRIRPLSAAPDPEPPRTPAPSPPVLPERLS